MRARELVRNMLAGILEAPALVSPDSKESLLRSSSSNNDDGSLCSTLTVDAPHMHKPLHEESTTEESTESSSDSDSIIAKTTTTTKKRVSFHSQATLISPASPHYLEQDEIEARWYMGPDYVHFKQTTSALAKTQGAAAPKDQAILLDLYAQCSNMDLMSVEQELEAKNPLVLTKILQTQLQELFHNESHNISNAESSKMCITGLERPMARFIHKDKYARRLSLVHLVYDVQEYAAGSGQTVATVDEELRQQCMALTQPSRLFAQHLAQAQWEANQEERA